VYKLYEMKIRLAVETLKVVNDTAERVVVLIQECSIIGGSLTRNKEQLAYSSCFE